MSEKTATNARGTTGSDDPGLGEPIQAVVQVLRNSTLVDPDDVAGFVQSFGSDVGDNQRKRGALANARRLEEEVKEFREGGPGTTVMLRNIWTEILEQSEREARERAKAHKSIDRDRLLSELGKREQKAEFDEEQAKRSKVPELLDRHDVLLAAHRDASRKDVERACNAKSEPDPASSAPAGYAAAQAFLQAIAGLSPEDVARATSKLIVEAGHPAAPEIIEAVGWRLRARGYEPEWRLVALAVRQGQTARVRQRLLHDDDALLAAARLSLLDEAETRMKSLRAFVGGPDRKPEDFAVFRSVRRGE